ncbi:helix-turn-helix transcriptional regulator [Flaviflagellibacter deserti]|uniref:Helix-turn-helix transcriptional regulator n=1 Tax=Flaviflagellibacter deserti TaxID=2267266 RepID=A0ABV9Z8I0_9HYPH
MRVRRLDPLPRDWQNFAWAGGSFDTARRPYTDVVEGTIRTPDHILIATLSGGAERIEVETDCGHLYSGPDRAGSVSFIPANSERRMRMRGVDMRWASIAFDPDTGDNEERFDFAPFTHAEDSFLFGLVQEFARLHTAGGVLSTLYCETMTDALRSYMGCRYGRPASAPARPWALAPWRLRRIAEFVDAHLERDIRIAELAQEIGLSAGHLHRAFRETTGATPLDFITRRRIERAMRILSTEKVSVLDLSLRVGFQSVSHFTRTFRRISGVNPSRFRGDL